MAVRAILIHPDDRLREVAEPVAFPLSDAVKTIISDMAETMYDAPGVGLAAPPIGGSLQNAVTDTLRRRTDEYEMALKMITQGRYKDARTLFHKVAVEDPKTKKYRVQMHYSWGLEHEDDGHVDKARKEFERALTIDPEFKRAHEALDRLPQDKKGSGFFSKIFGR